MVRPAPFQRFSKGKRRHACKTSAELTGSAGEQGKVDESMREMQAIEALKSEKADKEVSPND